MGRPRDGVRRGVVALAAATMSILPTATPAGSQDTSTGATTTPDGAEVVVGREGASGSGGAAGGRPRTCEHFLQDSDTAALPWGLNGGPRVDLAELREMIDAEVLVIRVCTWLDTGERTPPEVLVVGPSPAALARRAAAAARARLVLPLPDVRTAPPGGTVVGVPMWMWSRAGGSPSASATLGPVTATVTGTPARLVTVLDGQRRVCAGAGTAWDPARTAAGDWRGCTWRFARPGGFEATVTQVWRLRWTATTGDGGDLGEVARSATVPVTVRELSTVLRRG